MGNHTVVAVTAHYHPTTKNLNDLRVLVALAASANDANATTYIKPSELAPATGLHTNTVSAALKRLREQDVVEPVTVQDSKKRQHSGYVLRVDCTAACASAFPLWHDGSKEATHAPATAEAMSAPARDDAGTGTGDEPPAPERPQSTAAVLTAAEYLTAPRNGRWKSGTPLLSKLKSATTAAFVDQWRHLYKTVPYPANILGRLQKKTEEIFRATGDPTTDTAVRIVESVLGAIPAVRYYALSTQHTTGADPTPASMARLVLEATELLNAGQDPQHIYQGAQRMGERGLGSLSLALEDNLRQYTQPAPGKTGLLEATANAKRLAAQTHLTAPTDQGELTA